MLPNPELRQLRVLRVALNGCKAPFGYSRPQHRRSRSRPYGRPQPSNVQLVMVDGRILKRDGGLVAVNTDKIVDDAQETVERIQAEVKRRGITSKDVEKQLPFSASGR